MATEYFTTFPVIMCVSLDFLIGALCTSPLFLFTLFSHIFLFPTYLSQCMLKYNSLTAYLTCVHFAYQVSPYHCSLSSYQLLTHT